MGLIMRCVSHLLLQLMSAWEQAYTVKPMLCEQEARLFSATLHLASQSTFLTSSRGGAALQWHHKDPPPPIINVLWGQHPPQFFFSFNILHLKQVQTLLKKTTWHDVPKIKRYYLGLYCLIWQKCFNTTNTWQADAGVKALDTSVPVSDSVAK